MRRQSVVVALVALAVGTAIGFQLNRAETPVAGEAAPAATVAPKGGQDQTGPYAVVENWPKPLSQLRGHEKWTWGAVQGIFAESPNRVFVLMRGELPELERPAEVPYPHVAPSVSFPVAQTPFRNASVGPVSSPGNSGSDGWNGWKGKLGIDARWEHCLFVVDAAGNIIEEWTQWDKMFKRPHAVYVSPYDADKHVWIVDDHTHAIYKFTNDGKQLVQTIGTPNVSGADGTHFNRPTFMAWLPDGTFYVSDGYNGTRVAKFDASGKFLMDFGQRGESGKETRPGYMNNVHGVAVDVETRRVFVNDRDNHRIQIFDENGKYLSEWKIGVSPSSLHFVQIGADRTLVTFDRNTHKMLKYDLDGRLLYAWGTVGDFPGTLWGVHGMSTDQEGNLYVAEVDAGRFQKFRPRAGANPATLIGKPIYSPPPRCQQRRTSPQSGFE
jgi:DNA-binding beta-propeller fold protein YncE